MSNYKRFIKDLIVVLIVFCGILISCKSKKDTESINLIPEDEKIESSKKVIEKGSIKSNINLYDKIENVSIDKISGYYTFTLGKYQNEDIEWLIIDKNDDNVLLLSKKIIDCKNYNDEKVETSWSQSSLRKWLNHDFVDEALIDIPKNLYGNLNDFGFVHIKGDKVSLLSVSMCEKYFGTENSNKQNKKIAAKVTNYAKKMGVEYDKNKNTDFYDCGSFFLIDNGETLDKAAWVGQYGHIYTEGQFVKLENGDGIRPIVSFKTEIFSNGVIDLINSNIFNINKNIVNKKANINAEFTTNNDDETSSLNRSYVYSNIPKYEFQSNNVPCSEKNVVDLKSWKYGKTPVEWVYVLPNTQIISNISPNKSSKFGYKLKASSGPKGCYMVVFTDCDVVKGIDYDGRLYSFDDYTKISLDELKFKNKFDELEYGEYNVLDLLKKRYEMIDISKGIYMAGDVYVNIVYIDELDDIIEKGK